MERKKNHKNHNNLICDILVHVEITSGFASNRANVEIIKKESNGVECCDINHIAEQLLNLINMLPKSLIQQ